MNSAIRRILSRVRSLRARKAAVVVFLSLLVVVLILIPAITSPFSPYSNTPKQKAPDGAPKKPPFELPGQAGQGNKPASAKAIDGPDRWLPQGLPGWFRDLDADEDGQVALHQWRAGGKSLKEFREYDLNNDGFITAEEVLRYLNKPIELKAANGQANYDGDLDESDDEYRNKKHARIFLVKLDKGKTYQIDLKSKKFDAYLYLEDGEGELLDEDDDSGGGLDSRIIHRAANSGVYRIIATGLGSFRGGAYSLSIRVISNYTVDLPRGLPSWFKDLDKNQDGQVSFQEWKAAGKRPGEFQEYDDNNDGLITPDEVFRYLKKPLHAQGQQGPTTFNDTVEEPEEGRYRGKKAYKILTIKLEKGKTYQIDHVSKVFYAFTILEDPDGEFLDEHNSGGRDKVARIVYHAARTGMYRLVVTSQDGVKSGAFTLTVRILRESSGPLPPGLPTWFQELDRDGDGQIAMHEWRAGGKKLDEFRQYDLNDDGFITVEEMLRCMKKPIELADEEGQANFDYALEAIKGDVYRGKKAFKILTINLEAGKTYQFDCQSKVFQAFLYLEDAAGNPLAENSSPTVGGNSRIVFRAPTTGTYRIVATSLGGFRTGDFSFSVRRNGW